MLEKKLIRSKKDRNDGMDNERNNLHTTILYIKNIFTHRYTNYSHAKIIFKYILN